MSGVTMVRLRDGSQVPNELVSTTTKNLKGVEKEDLYALLDLVTKCKNPSYLFFKNPFSDSRAILESWTLIKGDQVDDSVTKIVLNSIEVSGLSYKFVNPFHKEQIEVIKSVEKSSYPKRYFNSSSSSSSSLSSSSSAMSVGSRSSGCNLTSFTKYSVVEAIGLPPTQFAATYLFSESNLQQIIEEIATIVSKKYAIFPRLGKNEREVLQKQNVSIDPMAELATEFECEKFESSLKEWIIAKMKEDSTKQLELSTDLGPQGGLNEICKTVFAYRDDEVLFIKALFPYKSTTKISVNEKKKSIELSMNFIGY